MRNPKHIATENSSKGVAQESIATEDSLSEHDCWAPGVRKKTTRPKRNPLKPQQKQLYNVFTANPSKKPLCLNSKCLKDKRWHHTTDDCGESDGGKYNTSEAKAGRQFNVNMAAGIYSKRDNRKSLAVDTVNDDGLAAVDDRVRNDDASPADQRQCTTLTTDLVVDFNIETDMFDPEPPPDTMKNTDSNRCRPRTYKDALGALGTKTRD
jgi:hypothetical protein